MVVGREKVTVSSDRKAALSEIVAALSKFNAQHQKDLVLELMRLSVLERHNWLTSRKDYILDHVSKYTYISAF